MIDHTKTTPEKLAEMNDSLIVDNNYLRERLKLIADTFGINPKTLELVEAPALREGVAEIKRLRHSLAEIIDDNRTFCDNVEIHKIAKAALTPTNDALKPRAPLDATECARALLTLADWHGAPRKTAWGDGMMAAHVMLTKDETMTVYVHRDALQAERLNSPAAQRSGGMKS